MRNARTLFALWAVVASGCINANFDPPHLVKGPRILDIRADPPEVAFGQDVLFDALVVDANGENLWDQPGVELRFMVCMSAKAVLSAAGLGFGQDLDDNCDEGGDDLVRLETGGALPPGTARLPGAAFFQLLTDLMSMGGGDGGGPQIDPRLMQTLTTIITTVGVPLRVRLEVWRDGEPILIGEKRFAITQRADPTTNPPPPRFAVGDVWLSARDGDDPRSCVPEAGEMPSVEAGTDVTMSPDENEEEWIESYPVVGLDGRLQTNEESAYYSWFSTGGKFSEDITQRPDRDVTWTAPDEPGVYPVWIVVRDGHLGTSYCRTDVTVVPAPM